MSLRPLFIVDPELIFIEDKAADTLAAYGSAEADPDPPRLSAADSTLLGLLASIFPAITSMSTEQSIQKEEDATKL